MLLAAISPRRSVSSYPRDLFERELPENKKIRTRNCMLQTELLALDIRPYCFVIMQSSSGYIWQEIHSGDPTQLSEVMNLRSRETGSAANELEVHNI